VTCSDDREMERKMREREREGKRGVEPGDEHCALYIYPGGEHCALNWGDVDEGTLLLEAGVTGGEHCAPGAGTIVAR